MVLVSAVRSTHLALRPVRHQARVLFPVRNSLHVHVGGNSDMRSLRI